MLITESRFDHQLKRVNLISTNERGMMNIYIVDPGKNLIEQNYHNADISQQGNTSPTFMAEQALQKRFGVNTPGYRDYRGSWFLAHGFGIKN